MKDFAMQLTQKCVSMGLLDESYSEFNEIDALFRTSPIALKNTKKSPI